VKIVMVVVLDYCSSHQKICSGVRVVHFTMSENLVVKSTMFLYQNICKYTWISRDGKVAIGFITYDKVMAFKYLSGELTVI